MDGNDVLAGLAYPQDVDSPKGASFDARVGSKGRAPPHDGNAAIPHREIPQIATLASVHARIQLAIDDGVHLALIVFGVREVHPFDGTPPPQSAALEAVFERLRNVAPGTSVLCRSGEDTFAALVHSEADFDGAACARTLCARLAEPYEMTGRHVRIDVSAGVVGDCSEFAHPQDALRDAARALERVKARIEDGVDVAQELCAPGRRRSRPPARCDLEHALQRNELIYHYQPIVELSSGRLVGCEALLRWRHPWRGTLLPGDFIGDLDGSGLLPDLGWALLPKALSRLGLWRQDSSRSGDLTMSINLSGKQLREPGIHDRLRQALARHRLPAEALCIEVTESTRLCGESRVIESLEQLADMGTKILLDDFGMGFASLRHLSELPIGALKLDRSFIRQLQSSRSHARIVGTMIELARDLGLDVVAEGVENMEQRELLDGFGCKFAQGFLFGEAMDPNAFTRKVAEPCRVAASSTCRVSLEER